MQLPVIFALNFKIYYLLKKNFVKLIAIFDSMIFNIYIIYNTYNTHYIYNIYILFIISIIYILFYIFI